MDVVCSTESHSESLADSHPLLMEHRNSHHNSDHIIDISGNGETSSSSSLHDRNDDMDRLQNANGPSHERLPASNPRASSNISTGSNSRNSSSVRRGDGRRRSSPLNSGLWISIELVVTLSQILASIIVLLVSRNEHPHTPLFAWIVGYASGCVATLPLLYWRYHQHNLAPERSTPQPHQTQINVPAGLFSLSVTRTEGEDHQTVTALPPRSSEGLVALNARFHVLFEYFKMGLDCFFAVWFVVGNVWIFGGHSSAYDAPNLYRLCIVFLTFSCIGYAMPFILCATVCCCLPCIIRILGLSEDPQTRGATTESINSLPTYKFKLKTKNNDESNSSVGEGGIVAAGTEKERVISGEDAICCICLAKYDNNDELRELPCCHFFHKECVDKWLKINALCPLCKTEVGESTTEPVSGGNDIP